MDVTLPHTKDVTLPKTEADAPLNLTVINTTKPRDRPPPYIATLRDELPPLPMLSQVCTHLTTVVVTALLPTVALTIGTSPETYGTSFLPALPPLDDGMMMTDTELK